jgi:hypothetical protein
MMYSPEQHSETYRGHAIRISAAAASDAPHRFLPRIEWVEQLAPNHVFYKLSAGDMTFADPVSAIAHGVALVKRWVDRMLSTTPA